MNDPKLIVNIGAHIDYPMPPEDKAEAELRRLGSTRVNQMAQSLIPIITQFLILMIENQTNMSAKSEGKESNPFA